MKKEIFFCDCCGKEVKNPIYVRSPLNSSKCLDLCVPCIVDSFKDILQILSDNIETMSGNHWSLNGYSSLNRIISNLMKWNGDLS